VPRAPRRCTKFGCDEKVPCPKHKRAPDRRKGARYSAQHKRDRLSWVPIVALGRTRCRRRELCLEFRASGKLDDMFIKPGAPWDLGHPDRECPWPTAPEHRRCNGATRGRDERRFV
jgi:hypothetical protein